MSENATIVQRNECIAIFEGYEKYEDQSGIWFKKEGLIKALHPKLQELNYHSSWDALLPVVLKAKALYLNYEDDPMREQLKMRYKAIENELCNLSLLNTNYCLYQFILWSQKQHPNDTP